MKTRFLFKSFLALMLGFSGVHVAANAQSTSFFVSDPSAAAEVKNALINLSQKGVFTSLHHENVATLSSEHQSFFNNNIQYDLLRYAEGNIFLNGKNDVVFVVYHKKEARVLVLLYDDAQNSYGELYQEYHVVNGLENADLPYGYQGTLDYVLGSALMKSSMFLEQYPTGYLNREPAPVMISNIVKDPAFNGLKTGTLSRNIKKSEVKSCLCMDLDMSDFSVECLQYDASQGRFVIIYSLIK